jgi:hypothetical protein
LDFELDGAQQVIAASAAEVLGRAKGGGARRSQLAGYLAGLDA